MKFTYCIFIHFVVIYMQTYFLVKTRLPRYLKGMEQNEKTTGTHAFSSVHGILGGLWGRGYRKQQYPWRRNCYFTRKSRQPYPKQGIISAGRQNRYGHPNQETLITLSKINVKPVSTQRYGMIRYRYYGSSYHWQTKLKGDEYGWMLPRLNNK